MGTLDSALSDLRTRGPEMLALARSWVEINSYTSNVAGVNAVGQRLSEAFVMSSLSCTPIPGGDGFGTHLVWKTPAAATAAPILLIGHHDTVFPQGHFEGWQEEPGRVTAPGVLDMKGGLAIIRTTLAAMDAAGALARLPVIVISVADEEVGSPSSAPHLRQLATGAACALVFESGRANDMIITRRKGVGAMTVTATGKAAHAGNNHKDGINAIWALAKFIDRAQAMTDHAAGITVNVGTITESFGRSTVNLETRRSPDDPWSRRKLCHHSPAAAVANTTAAVAAMRVFVRHDLT